MLAYVGKNKKNPHFGDFLFCLVSFVILIHKYYYCALLYNPLQTLYL